MKKYFFILVTLFSCLSISAKDVVFRASAPNSVVMGQQFRVEYTVNGDGKDFRASDFEGFDVLMGPSTSSSRSTQVINGKVSSETSKTYTYILMGSKVGDFSIPAATVKVDGGQYTSNALTVKVLPQDKASEAGAAQQSGNTQGSGVGANDVMVRMSLSKTKVYEGEAILATIRLFTINPQVQLQDAKFPSFDGFTVQEIELPQEKSLELEHVNGRNYYAVTMKQYLLYPQRSGNIEIGTTSLDLLIPVKVDKKMRSIFDDFFDNYQNVNKTVTSQKQSVESMPLPFGKPASYTGGVGEFKMSSSISTNELKANEALTLKLVISGNGNLKFTKDPEVVVPADFEVFDPKVDLNVKASAAGVTGSKTIEYTFIPRYAGDFEIAPVEFSYFDVKSKSYKTLSSPAYKIKVLKGAGGENNANVSNFSTANQENVKLLGNDIRFIKSGNLNLRKDTRYFMGSIGYYLSYILPLILFIVFFVIYRKQVRENANIALMKTKKANKVASKRLKLAAKYLKTHEKEPFYEEVLKAVMGYLSDKLNLPLSVLNRDNVEAELKSHNVDPALITEFMEIVSTCEFARYAPVASDEAMDKLYDSTVQAIGKMENVIRK